MTPLAIVDAFVHPERPFSGNPAAICLLEGPAPEGWLQAVAAEMNLSETAFLLPGDDPSTWLLRWFTPTCEVDLCGHATLASAHLLWETEEAPRTPLRFATRSGELRAEWIGGAIQLDFPAKPAADAEAPPGLLDALGARACRTATSGVDWLVEVATEAEVAGLAPDLAALGRIEARGVIVTAPSDEPDVDVVSRFFAPASGVGEDPVTGSAHCTLGPWWAPRLGRDHLVAHQLSARGGRLDVRVLGDRVWLGGRATTVLRGTWWPRPDR